MDDIEEYIKNYHHDILEILQHMAKTMYNMQYSVNLVLDDMEKKSRGNSKPEELTEYKAFFSKQFAKYNALSTSQRVFPK